MSKLEIYKDKRKEWRARLKSRNGKIIMATEGFKAKSSLYNNLNATLKGLFYCKVVYV